MIFVGVFKSYLFVVLSEFVKTDEATLSVWGMGAGTFSRFTAIPERVVSFRINNEGEFNAIPSRIYSCGLKITPAFKLTPTPLRDNLSSYAMYPNSLFTSEVASDSR